MTQESLNTYFCPRGCNACSERAAKATGYECGRCGSTLTTDQDAFEEAIERSQRGRRQDRTSEDADKG